MTTNCPWNHKLQSVWRIWERRSSAAVIKPGLRGPVHNPVRFSVLLGRQQLSRRLGNPGKFGFDPVGQKTQQDYGSCWTGLMTAAPRDKSHLILSRTPHILPRLMPLQHEHEERLKKQQSDCKDGKFVHLPAQLASLQTLHFGVWYTHVSLSLN